MKNLSVVESLHQLIKPLISTDDIVVDATMGQGYDTVFLAQHARFVYAFDIQEVALINTQKRCDDLGINNVKLILDSHEHIFNYIDDFKLVIFNLGYLPLGDKSITTQKETTLLALKSCINHLKKGRYIVMTMYPGHPAGWVESEAICAFLETLDPKTYKILRLDVPFATNYPPFSYIIKT
jgi:methylase of polypeptide subunit release factors